MSLTKNVKITRVMDAQAAGTDDTLTGSVLDMAGFEGVMFVALFGTLTASAVIKLKAQQDTAAAFNVDPQDLIGTAIQIDVAKDNDCLVLDIYKPLERYVRAAVTRATANGVVDGIIAIQYGASDRPTTHDATTIAGSEFHPSPAEGTA